MKLTRWFVVVLLVVPIAVSPADGQWVSFDEETFARVRIKPYSDGSGGPINDIAEKDIAVADLNKDGWDDVVAVRKLRFSNPGARQDLLLMNRNGRLIDLTRQLAPGFIDTPTDARDVFIADFTGDDWPDVVIANTFGEQPRFYRNRGEDASGRWLGLVDESSLRLPFIDVPGEVNTLQICAVWGGDLTGNGAPDIYLANYKEFGGTHDLLLANNGEGFFSNQTFRLGENANVAFGTSVEIYDMDNDGDQDVVKTSALYSADPFPVGTFILFNDGSGRFATLPYQELDSVSPYMFTVADFNEDLMLDVFLEGDFQDRVSMATAIRPDGPNDYATFVLSGSRTSGLGGNSKTADVDGDGDLDLGVAPIDVDIANCGFSNDFALLENTGSGLVDNWSAGQSQNFHVDPHDFGFIDVDRDGCMDMFMGLCTGWKLFIQNCS